MQKYLFFLLSFLASKVEAISCIIMSEGIRQKWEHLSEMELPPKNLGEKKKRMRWQRKKTEPSPSPSQPPVWHCIVWYTASSNQNPLSIQKLVTLHNKKLYIMNNNCHQIPNFLTCFSFSSLECPFFLLSSYDGWSWL